MEIKGTATRPPMKLSGAPICWAGVAVPDVLGGAEVVAGPCLLGLGKRVVNVG